MTNSMKAGLRCLKREMSGPRVGNLADYQPYLSKSTQHWLHFFSMQRRQWKSDPNQFTEVTMASNSRFRLCGFGFRSSAAAVAFTFTLLAPLASAIDIKFPQLQAAAEKGHVPQELLLASAYFTGHGVAQDNKMAAYWCQKAADSGDPEAENQIGFFYQTGIGVPLDPARAFHWYQLSSASGFVKAKVNLGVLYVLGTGVPKDEALAAQLFQEAASKGDGTAATFLGVMHYFGHGIKQDRSVAEKWFSVGAKLHDPVAAFDLGHLFSVQGDHPHDLPKAAKLLRQSAAGGFVPGMSALGLLLVRHPELAKSPQEARQLLEGSANLGSWRSSIVLGVLARDGVGVAANPAEAYYHFQVAVRQGGEPTRSLLRQDLIAISAKLTSTQTAKLSTDADTWFQQHHLDLAFVYKESEKWRRFPVTAQGVSADAIHAGQLDPSPQV
jgi:TPR repeat protein